MLYPSCCCVGLLYGLFDVKRCAKSLGRGESATLSLGAELWRQDAALCGAECPLVSEGCDSLVVVVFAQTIAPLYTISFP